MQGRNRILRIDVCDYSNAIKCNIYDNNSDIPGQAADVFVKYQRNGWKELSFVLPSTCDGEAGPEENYRLAYMIADYRLRIVTDDGTDYFLLTDNSVNHEAFSKKVTVTAGHISQLLKTRAMDLEFSDSEGNNVGTAKQFLTTILEGTGWDVGDVAAFYEDDCKTIKIRSMNASTKTGAFRLIEQMAELFEAKPVYNGDYTVDILPMNPFSELEDGQIPDAVMPNAAQDERYLVDSNVIELHYDKEVKKLERNEKTENICTRLYGYGAYGDTVSKYCSLQTATHEEYIYTVPNTRRSEYQVTDSNGVKRYFTAFNINEGDTLVWSMLDPTSQSYVWNENLRIAYRVYKTSKYQAYTVLECDEPEIVTNYFPYLSDYTYYDKVGLLSEESFQRVAEFQRNMAAYYKAAIDASTEASIVSEKLSTVGTPKSGYLKLDIESCEQRDDGTVLTIRWSDEYPDGIIYRSDYLQKEKNWFRWDVAQALKANGDPVSTNASIVYVLKKNTDPIQWDCAYLKDIDGREHEDVNGKVVKDGYDYQLSEGDKPKVITLWSSLNVEPGDSVYLFGTNSMNGKLGDRFSEDEAALETLENKTVRGGTVKNPTYFVDWNEPLPEINFDYYGWCYKYDSRDYDTAGMLYFSWPERGDEEWHNGYVQDALPEIDDGAYLYNTKTRTLWHCEGEWVELDSVDEQEVAKGFGVAFMQCRHRDQLYKGLYENYYYEQNSVLPRGNYAMPSAFGYYWLFTTDQDVPKDNPIRLDTVYGQIYQDSNIEHIVTPHCYPYDTLVHPKEDDLADANWVEGSIYINEEGLSGSDMTSDRMYRTNFVPVWPNETYEYDLPDETFVVLYDANRNYLGYVGPLSGEGEFETVSNVEFDETVDPNGYAKFKKVAYIKLTILASCMSETKCIHLKNFANSCFFDDLKYLILSPITHDDGEPIGINYLIKQFKALTDELYLEKIPALQAAQDTITAANDAQVRMLGDILREGWWQDGSYVEGDEQRMYDDALDNLKKISYPETTYTFDFLDLYGSQDMSIRDLEDVEWPDIKITDAAHLIDPELDINKWAYIDELNKCYDQPWKTTITINTQLTMMGQQEFKDVLTRIAEVASETKAKQTLYQRAEAISADGTLDAEKITGTIDTEDVQITGSGFTTDDKGNFIMESADGLAALRFNGSGLAMANSRNQDNDWEWRNIVNGFGIDADTITAGEIQGRLIKANSIRANSLMANVGNELDIGSNKALNLFATTDGVKPSGSLKTSDAMIEIKAGDGEDRPAVINVESGGELNLKGADINIDSGGSLNLSGADINVDSQGSIAIRSGGTFTVDGGNFMIDEDGDVTLGGEIHSSGAQLGGWFISDEHIGNAETMDESSVGLRSSTQANDVVIWAGNQNRYNAPFKIKANGSVITSDISITGGSFVIPATKSNKVVNNVIVNNDGIKIGWREAEQGETQGVDNYNFIVTKGGQAIATGLTIRGGTLTDCSGSLGAGSSMDGGSITDGVLTGGTITNAYISGGTIVGAQINNAAINRGEIHIGPMVNDVLDEKFTVTSDGTASIKKGTIQIGEYQSDNTTQYRFEVDSNGNTKIERGSIGGFTIDANGNMYCANGSAEDELHFMTNPNATSTTTGHSYLMWSGASDPLSANCVFRINKTGSITAKNLNSTGDCNIGISGGSSKLTVNGTVVAGSSREIKRNIKPIEHRDAFDQLEPVSFQYKLSDDTHFGLIYEDLINLYPELCHEDNEGNKGVAYIDMIAVLIKEVQDLRKRVAELERE